MKRRLPLVAWLAFVISGRLLMAWAAYDGLGARATWSPIIYAAAVSGLLISSLLALGETRGLAVLLYAVLTWFFQETALVAAVLRVPGHALAAENLHLGAVALPLFIAVLLEGKTSPLWRALRVAALFVAAGVPPLPGFFAHVEALSALLHADLSRLAVLFAFSHVALLVALLRLAVMSNENDAPQTEPANRVEVQ